MKSRSPAPESVETKSGPYTVYEALTTSFTVRSESPALLDIVDLQYSHLRGAVQSTATGIDVELISIDDQTCEIRIEGESVASVRGPGHLLHELDNHLVYHLQRWVPRFYFVHAACLASEGTATMIMGDSGAGKSTTAYALAAAGLEYLSDELSPIDVDRQVVMPYARSICLKNDPPAPLELPENYLRSEWTLHIDPQQLGATVASEPRRLERIVFLTHEPDNSEPRLKRLSSSDAALRLYQNALNQLAHEEWGPDDTVRLVSAATCYELVRGGVTQTVEALAETGVL